MIGSEPKQDTFLLRAKQSKFRHLIGNNAFSPNRQWPVAAIVSDD